MVNVNTAYPSKYVSAADLNGSEPTLMIRDCVMELIGQRDINKKPVLYFDGKEKGLALNKTNAMAIATLYGPESDNWKGHKVTLFVIMTEFQGRTVPGLRVRGPNIAQNEVPPQTAPRQDPNAPLQHQPAPQTQPDFGQDLDDSVPF